MAENSTPNDYSKSTYSNPVFSPDDDESKEESDINSRLLKDTQPSLFVEQSPYEEVAANVSNRDDPTLPCLTFRTWLLGLFFTCLLAFVNQFFSYRTIPLNIGMLLVQLITYPLGNTLAAILPRRTFRMFGDRWEFSFNPGPFSIKENCVISTMANAATYTAYAIDVITIQRVFYKRPLSYGIEFLFILSSQVLGYGLAGSMRRFLVWPSAMIWPGTLINCALFRTLHDKNDDDDDQEETDGDKKRKQSRWTMTRLHFFYLAFGFQFLWYWLPGYICPVLSLFSIFCLINPKSVLLSQLTGVNGLGIGSFELDWNAWVSFLGSPIVVPFWAQVNIIIGFVILAWIITPIAYYSNLWGAKRFPIFTNQIFTSEGYLYNVTNVLDSRLRLNETAYKIYGDIQLTPLFAISYGVSFAAMSSMIVHTILYYGNSIRKQFRSSLVDDADDIHAKLMNQYPEVPDWWYYILFVISFILSIVVCQIGQLMPWYWLLLALIVVITTLLPIAIVIALTNLLIGLNVVSEFIAGFVMPGNPIGNVAFKTYGFVTQARAISLLSDLKIGHYMKIPPRIMFSTQVIATIVAASVNYITALYLLKTVPNICTPANPEWKCPGSVTFFSASIIFGVIGPLRMFGPRSKYSLLMYGFPIGVILPIPAWLLLRKYPHVKWLKYVHFPVLLSGTGSMPPAPPGEFPSWFAIGFLFHVVLYRHAHDWWKRYAFVFSAAMSCGVAVCAIIIFFVFTNNQIQFPTWWGSGGITRDGCPLANGNFSGVLPHYQEFHPTG